jgi:GTPase SAR1 family protein
MVVTGEVNVGKSLLVDNIVSKKYRRPLNTYFPTKHVDFRIRRWTVDGATYALQIWDIPAHEKTEAVADGWFRGTDFMVFVYNVCERSTFEKLAYHLARYQRMVPEHAQTPPTWILVGTHRDRALITPPDKQVSEKEAQTFADTLHAINLRISLIDEFNFAWHKEIQAQIAALFLTQFEISLPC